MPKWCMSCGEVEMPELYRTFENGKWIEQSKKVLPQSPDVQADNLFSFTV